MWQRFGGLPCPDQKGRRQLKKSERRSRNEERDPQSLSYHASNRTGIARAVCLRGQGCCRRHHAEAEYPCQEEHHQAERRACERIRAETADHRRIGCQHGDPGQLSQHDGRSQIGHPAEFGFRRLFSLGLGGCFAAGHKCWNFIPIKKGEHSGSPFRKTEDFSIDLMAGYVARDKTSRSQITQHGGKLSQQNGSTVPEYVEMKNHGFAYRGDRRKVHARKGPVLKSFYMSG